jgi:hypothetical protein
MLLLAGIFAVIVVGGLLFAWRYGIPAGYPTENVNTPITFEPDGKTEGFKTDWSEYQERPVRDDGPDWDS